LEGVKIRTYVWGTPGAGVLQKRKETGGFWGGESVSDKKKRAARDRNQKKLGGHEKQGG